MPRVPRGCRPRPAGKPLVFGAAPGLTWLYILDFDQGLMKCGRARDPPQKRFGNHMRQGRGRGATPSQVAFSKANRQHCVRLCVQLPGKEAEDWLI